MLSPKEINERLENSKDSRGNIDRNRRVSALPTRLCNLGQILITNEYSLHNREKRIALQKQKRESQDELFQLNAKDRNMLFYALFPNIAKYVEATWNLFNQLPYQTGNERRPFRLKSHNSSYKQYFWLQEIIYRTTDFVFEDIIWFATWAGYLGFQTDQWGYLFAGAISVGDENSQKVFEILKSSAESTHEIAKMGRHVVRGLLSSTDPKCWDYIYHLLLAAQREEGLRQVILEAADEAQPQAFINIVHIILDNHLCRFSATIRASSIWFGLPFDNTNEKKVNEILTNVLKYLEFPVTCEETILNGKPIDSFYALWAKANYDAESAQNYAIQLTGSNVIDKRYIATYLLSSLCLKSSNKKLIGMLEDPDLRVCALAFQGLTKQGLAQEYLTNYGLFEGVEKLIHRLEKERISSTPLVWDWIITPINKNKVANALPQCLGKLPLQRLTPYFPIMESSAKSHVIYLIEEKNTRDNDARQILFSLCGDTNPSVRDRAIKALHDYSLSNENVEEIESLITKKSESFRRAGIQLLLELDDKELLESITRLLQKNNENQILAGLDLINECKKSHRCGDKLTNLTKQFVSQPDLTTSETRIIDNILDKNIEHYSLDNVLGLIDPNNLTKPEMPTWYRTKAFRLPIKLGSDAAIKCLTSLNQLIEKHKDDVIENETFQSKQKILLSDTIRNFRRPDPTLSLDQNLNNFPLRNILEEWWQTRSGLLQDPDGFELIRALAIIQFFGKRFKNGKFVAEVSPTLQKIMWVKINYLDYYSIINPILEWLILLHPADNEIEFILDSFEASIQKIPLSEITAEIETDNFNRPGTLKPLESVKRRTLNHEYLVYQEIAYWHRTFYVTEWGNQHHIRLWKTIHWLNQPNKKSTALFDSFFQGRLISFTEFPTLQDTLFAYQAGAAKKEDLYLQLMDHRTSSFSSFRNFNWISLLSSKKHNDLINRFPFLEDAINEIRQRIVDIEVNRGDLPTEASNPASNLQSVPGVNNLFKLLAALGKSSFDRQWVISQDRSSILSHLIQKTYPLATDSTQDFVKLATELRIPETRLIELAVFAPQWATYVEQVFHWTKFAEGVWWLYAHTKDRQWRAGIEFREEWATRISEYTPLSADRLMDGAVDVAWFNDIYSALGEKHWNTIHKAALYASGGAGHARARLFADAMLGNIEENSLIGHIQDKRHQDSIRALGLIPLDTKKNTQEEVLHRYKIMQNFLQSGKKFGSQRKASEKLAVEIGMVNLARTAGYSDPQRLEWAMERESIKDLAAGPILVEENELELSLAINDLGEPELSITNNGKPLKSIPSTLKKNERVSTLLERKQELTCQVSRMRNSLEQSMCKGDLFPGSEISELFEHPMLREMIQQIIFIAPNGTGYPVQKGTALQDYKGDVLPILPESKLRIAHPVDLLNRGDWPAWQHECFIAERIQPFKQVFRELYVPTKAEISEANLSRRYAGHQIQPHQALALFGTRGWISNPEEGVQKTFHSENISVHVGFLQGILTPAEVEDLTMEFIVFTKKGEFLPITIDKVPERLFSEVMRDIDLVVSVAHSGGVDPESSSSSIESRISLINETCTLLHIPNIKIKDNFVIIDGKLGRYNIHMGSGVVHKEPGEAICIIPVHGQHRGRLFLPFVDNDPKTAEILSKVILLAQDEKIKDPTILEQIL
jgi:hypothetical protein